MDLMANNPPSSSASLNAKSKLGSSLRITSANSPVLKPATRSPSKSSSYQSILSLQTVIGTTTSNPNGFSFHEPTKSFALCAGSATILAELDADLNISQRFFRARPTATGINPVASFYNPPNPPTTPDSRNRSLQPAPKSVANGAFYPGSPTADWGEVSGSRTWTSRERIKAVTSVSISPNGRFLGVGETGYNPRVLIFSTAKDSPQDIPLSILTEHTFGVRSLAFSPDSQYLATLGDINDGFLFIWSVNLKTGGAKLHSTNKCTSFVRAISWMGQNLITVGIRHVKVWRLQDSTPSSPSKVRFNLDSPASSASSTPRALNGRNCLLGNLKDCTFTCVASISDQEAVVCSDSGTVCVLDDTGRQQKLRPVKNVGYGITSITLDHESANVWLGGRDRTIEKHSIEGLRSSSVQSIFPTPEERQAAKPKAKKKPGIVSMGVFLTHMITIDSTRAIRVCPLDRIGHGHLDTLANISLPAHRDAVLGIGVAKTPNPHNANFFTWSSGGTVNFWGLQGKRHATMMVDLEQPPGNDDELNELKVLRASEDMKMFFSGDRYGVIRAIAGESWKCITDVRAHGGEVTDIVVQSTSDMCLVATSGRDRMVQLFRSTEDSLELVQTMDDHVGAVGRLLFMNDGEKLLSCSADRTVLIRERMTREVDGASTIAFFISKVITLKASPVSMIVAPDDPDTLVLSTIDRHIHKFDILSGRHVHSFRAADPETNDTVVMSSLAVEPEIPGQSPRLLVGVSSTDKSIRVYDFEKDVLLTREFGHTEGVSDVILLESEDKGSKVTDKKTLISTGLDGVIMIWDLSTQTQVLQESPQAAACPEDETPAKELTVTKPPLRRILSKTELSAFQRHDSPVSSPTPVREQSPPRIRRKTSRYTLNPHSLKNGNGATPTVPTPPLPPPRRSPTSNYHPEGRARYDRSPSPPSPKSSLRSIKTRNSSSSLRRPSLDFRSSRSSKANGSSTSGISGSEFGSLNMSTEQVCRTLRAYRKKLTGSNDYPHAAGELEKELDLTVRALDERTKKTRVNGHASSEGNNNNKNGASLSARVTKRVPSTPNLRRPASSRKLQRKHSLDADSKS